MLAVRSLLRASSQPIKNAVQQRNMSAISVPARQKVSTGEIIFLGGLMVSSWLFIPAWVLVNMKHYRTKE